MYVAVWVTLLTSVLSFHLDIHMHISVHINACWNIAVGAYATDLNSLFENFIPLNWAEMA